VSPPSICCKADGAPSICSVLRSLRHLQLVCLCGWDLATIYAAAGKRRHWSSSSSRCTSNQFTFIMCRINTERPAKEFHRCARVNARMNTFGARGFWSGCMTPSPISMHADNNHCIWAYDSKRASHHHRDHCLPQQPHLPKHLRAHPCHSPWASHAPGCGRSG
jgi:hypothetical protein